MRSGLQMTLSARETQFVSNINGARSYADLSQLLSLDIQELKILAGQLVNKGIIGHKLDILSGRQINE